MYNYQLQVNKVDALQSTLAQGATSGTLTAGVFGSPADKQLLVIDYDIPAKLEVIRCNIAGTALTSVERGLDGTSDVEHLANAKVMMAFVPSHYSNIQGLLKEVRYYTANDTWNKPVGLKFVIIKARGGGGGGGGVGTTTGTGASGGGGQGEYAEKKIDASALASTVAVTIGAGGNAGTTSSAGGPGGTTSFGSHVTAVGGGGGGFSTGATRFVPGGLGGTGGTGADLAIRGQAGFASTDNGSQFNRGGGGGEGGARGHDSGVANGEAGVRGGGGSGAIGSGTTGQTGGAGGAGWMTVEEYY